MMGNVYDENLSVYPWQPGIYPLIFSTLYNLDNNYFYKLWLWRGTHNEGMSVLKFKS